MTTQELHTLTEQVRTAEPTEDQIQMAAQLLNNCMTITLALRALQAAIRETVKDEEGALLMSRSGLFTTMASHEAETM